MDKKEVLRRSQYAHDDEYANEIKHKGRTFGMYFTISFLFGMSMLLRFSGNNTLISIFGVAIQLSDLLLFPFILSELCYQMYIYYYFRGKRNLMYAIFWMIAIVFLFVII